jgi:hypothetical protein
LSGEKRLGRVTQQTLAVSHEADWARTNNRTRNDLMKTSPTHLPHRSSPRSSYSQIGFTILLLLTALTGLAAPFGSAFTYQGRLNSSGSPSANGLYDFRFTLHDAATLGSSVGSAVAVSAVPVTNGLFTVQLNFGATAFTSGEARWLQLEVNTNGVTSLITLSPRQRVNPAPQAIYAGSSASATTATTASSVAAGAVTSSSLAPGAVGGPAIADGSITSADLNPSLLNNTFWKLVGNDVAPGQFLGSTNNQPLEIRANNFRALRLEPRGVGSPPNLVGGYHNNTAGNFSGVAIAGGGTQGSINQVAGDYAFIGAGHGGYPGPFAAVVGGAYNTSLGQFSFVGTGQANTNLGLYAAIVAGSSNAITALADHAFIGGGQNNVANNTHATVGGGEANRATSWATVGGGRGNQSDGAYATIAGGRSNNSGGTYATVPGGYLNSAAGQSSFAAGTQAKANHQGSFVWADSLGGDFASTTSNQFSIRAAGGVQLSPLTSLNFGQTTRQMLNLWSTNYGVGVQSLTTYFRTDSADGGGGFAWYQGGMHSDANQDPGAGGRKLMSLTGDGLTVRSGSGRALMSVTDGGLGVVGNGTGSAIYAQNIGPGLALAAYNPDPNGWAASFDGRVTMSGNVGIGTTQPSARLSVVAPGASELIGSARSATLLTSAGGLGTTAGDELALATFGFGSGNNSSLGIRALRVTDGSSWPSTAIGLGMDVDNTVRAGASLWLNAYGNVGIGTSVPAAKLDVADGDIRLSSGRTIISSGRLHIQANEDLFLNPFGGAGTVIVGGGGGPGNLRVLGTTTTGVLTITGGADIAEPFKMSGQDLPKGSVVVIDEANPGHLRLSESAYDTRVAGIISGANGVNPGISLSQQGVMEGDQDVALSGRVYVQADASNGAIKPGDLLTTSATPGHAMKVTEHGKAQGAILGKAMTALAEGKGMVLVLVTLQ